MKQIFYSLIISFSNKLIIFHQNFALLLKEKDRTLISEEIALLLIHQNLSLKLLLSLIGFDSNVFKK